MDGLLSVVLRLLVSSSETILNSSIPKLTVKYLEWQNRELKTDMEISMVLLDCEEVKAIKSLVYLKQTQNALGHRYKTAGLVFNYQK